MKGWWKRKRGERRGYVHVTIHVSYTEACVCLRRIYDRLGECGGCWGGH